MESVAACHRIDSPMCVIEERVNGLTLRVDGIEHRFQKSLDLLQKMFWGIVILLLTNLAGLTGIFFTLWMKGGHNG